jgi:uncharacterized membrane protein (DUF4010 family)
VESSGGAHHVLELAITIALTLVMGVEREETGAVQRAYRVAGVRTFPIVGALGYSLALLTPGQPLALGLAFAALTGFLAVAYHDKLRSAEHGATTEMAVLVAFVVGALVAHDETVLAAAITVGVTLLLQAKVPLERFAEALPPGEIATFVRFLLLTAVVLPVLPNHEYTAFHLNPFRTWLVVAVVSALSYLSYLVSRLTRGRHSAVLTGLLGGAYSSTLTTVVLARQSREQPTPLLYAGAITLASAVMYARIAVLVWAFNASLGQLLGPRLLVLALASALVGLVPLLAAKRGAAAAPPEAAEPQKPRNPLELTTALTFAAVFIGISVATRLVTQSMGTAGLYSLGALSGLVDVDAFIMGLTQSAGSAIPLAVAAAAIVIAAAANNVIKGIYAVVIGERVAGRWSLALLSLLAAASLLALIRLV